MNDFIKWVLKVGVQMVVWVFILSIKIHDRTIFAHLNDALVQNSIVAAADAELAELWDRAFRATTSGADEIQEQRRM